MPKRQPDILLEDIIERAEKIISYTQSLSYNQLIADSKAIDAVV
jgi:uncharacterized protein with HEPN domain